MFKVNNKDFIVSIVNFEQVNIVLKIFLFHSEAYLELSQTSLTEVFVKIVNGQNTKNIFTQKLHHRCLIKPYIRPCQFFLGFELNRGM